jgi:hypothetical protein
METEQEGEGGTRIVWGGQSHTLRMKLLHVGKHGTRAKTLEGSLICLFRKYCGVDTSVFRTSVLTIIRWSHLGRNIIPGKNENGMSGDQVGWWVFWSTSGVRTVGYLTVLVAMARFGSSLTMYTAYQVSLLRLRRFKRHE